MAAQRRTGDLAARGREGRRRERPSVPDNSGPPLAPGHDHRAGAIEGDPDHRPTGRLGRDRSAVPAPENTRSLPLSCLRQSAARLRLLPRPSAGPSGQHNVRPRRRIGELCALGRIDGQDPPRVRDELRAEWNPPRLPQGRHHGPGLAGRDVPDLRPRPIVVRDDDAAAVRAERRSERRTGCLSDSTSPSRAGVPDDGVGGGVHARHEAAVRAPRRATGRAATWPQRRCRALAGCRPFNGTIVPSSVFQTALSHALPRRRTTRTAREFGLNAVLTARCQPGSIGLSRLGRPQSPAAVVRDGGDVQPVRAESRSRSHRPCARAAPPAAVSASPARRARLRYRRPQRRTCRCGRTAPRLTAAPLCRTAMGSLAREPTSHTSIRAALRRRVGHDCRHG